MERGVDVAVDITDQVDEVDEVEEVGEGAWERMEEGSCEDVSIGEAKYMHK